MNTTVEVIKQLRQQTGAGVMACRKALQQSSQDYARALDFLREQAALQAKKRTDHEARQGRIELYSHSGGRIGVMIEINAETEFASRSQVFRSLAHELALQITLPPRRSMSATRTSPPACWRSSPRPPARKRSTAGKPEKVMAQIVEGALEKYRNKHVLLRQPYLHDESLTVAQLLTQAIGQIGENIIIRRFPRWEICPDAEMPPPAP